MIVTRGVFLFLLSAKGTGMIGVNVYERNALALGEDVMFPSLWFPAARMVTGASFARPSGICK